MDWARPEVPPEMAVSGTPGKVGKREPTVGTPLAAPGLGC